LANARWAGAGCGDRRPVRLGRPESRRRLPHSGNHHLPFYVISLVVVIIAAAFPELMLSVPKYLMPQFMR
jgi:hypothetical protein